MKKVFSSGMLIMLLLSAVNVCYAQSDRKVKKMQDRQYKTNLKLLKKQGWVSADKTFTLDFALAKFYKELFADESNNQKWYGNVLNCKATCADVALSDAQSRYAQLASANVRKRVVGDMFNNESAPQLEEFSKFYAGYEILVSKELSGLMKQYLAIERPNNAGGKEYEIWYIINEAEASKARLRAMQAAFEETRLAQQYADQVAKFVREGFKQDE